MAFAEDSRKVQRIVKGSFQGLQQMYLPLIKVSFEADQGLGVPGMQSACMLLSDFMGMLQ